MERATAVTLSAQPTTGVGFFRDAACATAAATGLASASQDETLRTGPVGVSFVTSAQTLATNGCSGKMELEARDSGANPTFFSAPRSVTLSGSGLTFFSDATCTTPLSSPVFAAGAPRFAFYFKGKTNGTIRLSAAVAGLTPVSQDQTIRQVVRSGFCEMSTGRFSVTCPIAPEQIDLSRTVLFVQANPEP